MVALVRHDLEFILRQIEIAEAHAGGGILAELVAGYNGNDGLTQAHLLPYGLRTVDGSYNNLLPGREKWGASDQSFPGLFTPTYINDADGDRYDFNPLPNMETWFSNNDYANAGARSGSQPGPGSGTVIDADPRIISNLIVDQTLDNPAAIAAALTHAGLAGQPLMTALSEIVSAHSAAKAAPADLGASAGLAAKLVQYGVEMDGNTIYLPNVSPDEGLSSPFNGWMTIFGQFFDHGLDLVAKGGNGTVYVPLSPGDPLYVPGGQNYIPLTRVSVEAGADGVLGTTDDGAGPRNLTTPWVDQNQTYASTASKQVFMREYIPAPDGKPIASGHLLEGGNGGLATWADIKAQARDVLGIALTDLNVGNIPLVAADQYGNFIPGPNGYPQLVVGMGPDGVLGTADDVLREGDPAAPVSAQGVVLTGHAFLDDIAHAAVPVVTGGELQADGDTALGYGNADGTPGPQGQRGATAYDNELLDRHFVAGDGRANENIALTAVHQVFHAEHNRVVEMTKQIALDSGDLTFLNKWLLVDVEAIPTTDAGRAALVWDGERLFQAGRFTNEMEYQHLVFEEFGRMMQPDIDAFVFEPSADINPSIAAEFAHVVYRFGHSMLRQDIAVIAIDAEGKPVQNDITLFDGFLNPVMYDSLGAAEVASGAIIRGMSRQTGSEIDEFVTDVLRNQLLGIPLDLATINLARGRDVGTPTLNVARGRFFEETGDTLLKPYESWADFALNLKNPASIINFVAAYGNHASVLNTTDTPRTTVELREAATRLVLGDSTLTGTAKADFDADRLDFLNHTGAYAGDGTLGGLNTVDFWMGGLAEKKMAFGGMLGSTFSFVFQMTMENLQDADRFYYLSRTQGLNLLNELENNTFAELVMRNTDLGAANATALPGNLFSAFQMPTLELDIGKQLSADPVLDNPFLGGFSKLVERVDADSDGVAEAIRVNSNEHFTIGGTEDNDIIVSGGGDDAIWGKGGDDRIEAGYGVDKVFGGAGDDILTNAGTDIGEADFLHGNEGNDVIHGGSGLSLLFGNQGNDFIVTGPDGKEAFAGTGEDFVLGGTGGDVLLGNEGNDWLEGGLRFDSLSGENSELFFNSTIIGHDVLNGGSGDTDYDGESGDDIMFQNSEGIQRSNGMAGFDWAIHKGDSQSANSNLGIPIFETQEAFILRDRFDLVEGLSGWKHDDVLTGRITAVNTRPELEGTAAIPGPNALLDSYSNNLLAKNVGLISGLAPLVAHLGTGTPVTRVANGQAVPVLDENGAQERVILSTADASDILLGGGGSDVITGLAGNDIIDGDRWLNVRIRFVDEGVAYTVDEMGSRVYLEADYVNGAPTPNAIPQFGGRPLTDLMFDRTINPGQLAIVREMVDGDPSNSAADISVYRDVLANYAFTSNADGSMTVTHTPTTGVDPTPEGDGTGEPGEGIEGEPDRISDGADRLFHIETLRFSNGNGGTVEYTLDQLPFRATGAPVIIDPTPTDGRVSPTEGAPLTIDTRGIEDVNGLGAFRYQWQASNDGGTTWRNLTVNATGSSFTPSDGVPGAGGQVGEVLRARVEFTDGAGHQEELFTMPTGIVGDNWDAIPFLANTFNGTAGDDIADGTSGVFGLGASDTLNGNGGYDILNGAGGSDTLNGGAGDDRLDGGAGTDVAVFSGGVGNFALGSGGTTNLVVTDLTGAEGSDTLSTIETLRFAGTNSLVVAGTTGNNVNLNGATGAAGSQAVFGFAGTDRLNGGGGSDLLVGGQGADTIQGDAGSDTIYWSAGDGRDLVNGDTTAENIVGGIDTLKIIGDTSAETYRVYSRTSAFEAGIADLDANTEIVITRNGTSNESIIAELNNIEEIFIGGRGGNDTFMPIGDFSGTSLLTSTITLEGSADDDTVDISSLASDHRVVFRTHGGDDRLIGPLRSQDLIELQEGTAPIDYAVTADATNGITRMTKDGHSISFSSTGGLPKFGSGRRQDSADQFDDEHEVETGPSEPVTGHPGMGEPATDSPSQTGEVFVGGPENNTFIGTARNETFDGGAGTDRAILDFAFGAAIVGLSIDGVMTIAGPDGVDSVRGIEVFQFADRTIDNADGSPLVDDLFYLYHNPDVAAAGQDADAHYAAYGAAEGRDPNAYFSTKGYLATYTDVAKAGLNPLSHYDADGWKEGRDPGVNFDTQFYLARNTDVKAAGLDPLTHYLEYGQAEGRAIFDAVGLTGNIKGGFDAEFYLLANADVAQVATLDGGDTLAFARQHFDTYGWKEGRDPNAVFDTKGYLAAYGDVAAAGINPLAHYDTYGWKEGRDPSADFDSSEYLAVNGDVAQAGLNPMQHYLQYGLVENRAVLNDGTFGAGLLG
ncbi:peroxidase family protein [Methylobacterium flocculans]|uniref:peroxidase family protein n=1 Tax=Methylobacterium flocculans TaxID=2984843 RepID=UPI0021F37A9F|nr:peroxidase family protein [Methylobacterium sp. FF17]